MLLTRYYLLMLLYHVCTIFKQRPLMFIKGFILFPFYYLRHFLAPPQLHKSIIEMSFENIERYWQTPDAAMPPEFIKTRLEAVRREASA